MARRTRPTPTLPFPFQTALLAPALCALQGARSGRRADARKYVAATEIVDCQSDSTWPLCDPQSHCDHIMQPTCSPWATPPCQLGLIPFRGSGPGALDCCRDCSSLTGIAGAIPSDQSGACPTGTCAASLFGQPVSVATSYACCVPGFVTDDAAVAPSACTRPAWQFSTQSYASCQGDCVHFLSGDDYCCPPNVRPTADANPATAGTDGGGDQGLDGAIDSMTDAASDWPGADAKSDSGAE